jgi:hypothetical protein
MSLLIPSRIDQPELLDEHDAPRLEMERSLRDLRRINRYLGGIITYRKLLRRLGGTEWLRLSVLDIGTGSSDLLETIEGEGLHIGLDFKIDHLLYAGEVSRNGFHKIRRVVGDARRLPFRDGSVDVATSAHLVHHFTPDENAEILRDSLRIVRRGVAVNDTERHRLPLLFIRLLGLLRLIGRITRFDGPASVLRGYTPGEARAIANRTGASRVAIARMHPFRIGILLWK